MNEMAQNISSRFHLDNSLHSLRDLSLSDELHKYPSLEPSSYLSQFPNHNNQDSCRYNSPPRIHPQDSLNTGSHNYAHKPPESASYSRGLSSVDECSSTSQSINGIPVPKEVPLDVRIRRLLHSTSSGSPFSTTDSSDRQHQPPQRKRTPLLPENFSRKEKLKSTPLLQSPLESLPLSTPSFNVTSNSHGLKTGSQSPLGSAAASRRTLLPTPSDEDVKPSHKTIKQPLLHSAPKSAINYSQVTSLAAETSLLFLRELGDIIRKDLERRLIEGYAFRSFDNWWESQNKVSIAI